MEPCKKQSMFGSHYVVQIIATYFVYDEPSILGTQWTQLYDDVVC